MKILLILFICISSLSLHAQLFVVPKATEPVQIDGQVSAGEWQDAITNSKIANLVDGEVNGIEDLSASLSVKWDEANLYFLFQITDDMRSLDSSDGDRTKLNTFDDDSIELYLDMNNTKTGGLDPSNKRYQYRFIPLNGGEIESFPINLSDEGLQLATQGDQAYILEIAIPWETLRFENPEAGHVIGFDVALNDDDDGDGRDGQLLWYATGRDDWSDPSKWGNLILTAPVDEIENATIENLPSMQVLDVGDQTWIAWNEVPDFDYQLRKSSDLNIWQNDGRELLSTGTLRYFVLSPDDIGVNSFFQLLVATPDQKR